MSSLLVSSQNTDHTATAPAAETVSSLLSPSRLVKLKQIERVSFNIQYAPMVRVIIKGRVQGVCYRNWTVDNAEELGLKGWVRNRMDGSVEALFSGQPEKVKEMEERCSKGPPAAKVTGLQVFPCTDDPGTTFECKLTV